jgi:fatty-acyl-CoA synthase
MSDAMALSRARGPARPALLDETIGANLRRTVARFADRQALVDAPMV